ncbi:glycoside hydrolase family 18 protein [Maribacter sp. HTCC2170]|uniref:glycoside hydrolase family 18 protein n=1 Tax=Maribacter sp. (strain HTCC2170 / KCCM 42371) TaxID=313603 RepID=UPI00006BE086|nr:glycoside hydrolase family 18 protein [Maribacter sp. HTCC2170]EAQ99986.1 chitinase A1 precursor [Maribacter sp. HTCC2170]
MKIVKILGFLFLGIALVSFTFNLDFDKTVEESTTVVMAYYVPEKEYAPEKLPLGQLTHIIFSFTNVIDGEMKFRHEENGGKLKQLVAQRKSHPDLKVMIACGGWGADGFSDMAHTAENRKKFVESVVAFNAKYELDGLDMDWEYPAIPAAGTGARPEDKENFTLLMKELREGLNTLKRVQTLTFASAGWERYYKNVEINEVMKHVDYMNVMTYDQIGSTSPFTGHHTALGLIKLEHIQGTPAWDFLESRKEEMKKRGYTFKPRSVKSIVDFCIGQGVDPKQIVIGSAFYGRAWKGVPPKDNGLYQENSGSHIGWSGYSQIRKEFEVNKNYKRYWDPVAEAPYLYSAKDSIFISYDDTVSVRLKTEYALKKKLGGIMFWQLGNDTKEVNSLLKSMYDASVKGL